MMVMPLPVAGAPPSPMKPPSSPMKPPPSPTTRLALPAPPTVPTRSRAPASPPLSPVSAAKMDRVLHGVRTARLRASLLQSMLALLDREDERGLLGALSVLDALSSLPLDDPRARARCLACLRALDRRRGVSQRRQSVADRDGDGNGLSVEFGSDGDDEREVDVDELDSEDVEAPASASSSSSSSRSSWAFHAVHEDAESMPPSFVLERPGLDEARRESGRAKSVSLRHCRAFLLACANEIHELDAEDPAFDYAEDTWSESLLVHLRPAPGSVLDDDRVSWPHRRPLPARGFDIASSAADATSVATTDLSFRLRDVDAELAVEDEEGEKDDVEADQGSQLSDVLYRAEFLTEDEDEDEGGPSPVETPRRGSHSTLLGRFPHEQAEDCDDADQARSQRALAASRAPAALAAKLRAFRAWQRARGLSPGCLAVKRRAFRRLQRLRERPEAAYRLFPTAMPVATRSDAWASARSVAVDAARAAAIPRSDAALLLLLALLVHAAGWSL